MLNPFIEPDFVAERVEKMKASIRARVEHAFRVLKRQFGFTKVRYRCWRRPKTEPLMRAVPI